MKKIFILAVAFVSLFSSCSKDESSSSTNTTTSQLVATINGTKKTFNTVQVSYTTYYKTNDFLRVTASINNNPNEIIEMDIQNDGSTGSQNVASLDYLVSNVRYSSTSLNSTRSTIIQTNSNKKLVGTFVAKLYEGSNGSSQVKSCEITDGSFSLSY